MKKLPEALKLTWQKGKENLPKESGLFVVLCRDRSRRKRGKLIEWFTYAEYLSVQLTEEDTDHRHDQWNIVGPIDHTCYPYCAWKSASWFEVIAWAKAEKIGVI